MHRPARARVSVPVRQTRELNFLAPAGMLRRPTEASTIEGMIRRRLLYALVTLNLLGVAASGHGQDESPRRHGRKYKAPPPISHIEVVVIKNATGKPVPNAAVIFRALREGKDDGNLEVKTDPEGRATIDVISTGSLVQVQVIANGFATFADSYQVDEPTREIYIALLKPQEQVSAYEDNSGKESGRKAGVQEPIAPSKRGQSAGPALSPEPRTAPSTPPHLPSKQNPASPAAPAAPPSLPPETTPQH